MKKFKTICSAVAALTMLALAGCDLEIPVEKKVNPPQPLEVEDFDFDFEGATGMGRAILPMDFVSEETGISISFAYKGLTSDWSPAFNTTSTFFALPSLQYTPAGTWKENYFPQDEDRERGENYLAGDAWTIFTAHNGGAGYVTVSFDENKEISFYLDGSLAVRFYGKGNTEGATVEDLWTAFVYDVATEGFTFRPSGTSQGIGAEPVPAVSHVHIDYPLDVAGAKELYEKYLQEAE